MANPVLVAAGLAASLGGCGGGGSPAAPNPTPAPTANPTPAPTPTPDPQANLAPGPVTRFDIKVRSIALCRGSEDLDCNAFRPKTQDPDGAWVVCEGDFVVFDGNQVNAQGQECKWASNPVYTVDDPDGVLSRLNSSNPFLLRTDVVGRGDVKISAEIDGIGSNPGTLLVRAKRNGCPPGVQMAPGAEQ
ncbi:MAG TPA: hypothetical protein VMT87_07990 [Vicinamibacteria bacterium]|nr:hypothetical protein [Vicinamibacteria bacterium]